MRYCTIPRCRLGIKSGFLGYPWFHKRNGTYVTIEIYSLQQKPGLIYSAVNSVILLVQSVDTGESLHNAIK